MRSAGPATAVWYLYFSEKKWWCDFERAMEVPVWINADRIIV